MAEDPIHVGSGSFRVDRARMLRKLSEFQLRDPVECLLAWVRAGVAAGASKIRFHAHQKALEVRFDGTPYSADELAAPYDALFEEASPADARRRFLAIGLLGAQRLEPHCLTVASGEAGRRRGVAFASALDHAPAPPGRGPGTRIRVSSQKLPGLAALADLLAARCGYCPIPLVLGDRTLLPGPGTGRPHGDGIRCSAAPYSSKDGSSRVTLSIFGVSVETLEVDARPSMAWVQIDDSRLRLDASQAKLVRDGRFEETLERARGEARHLLESVCGGHRADLSGAGALMAQEPGLLSTWRRAFGSRRQDFIGNALDRALGSMERLAGGSPQAVRAARATIERVARATRWTRDCIVRSLSGTAGELLTLLWAAPVLLDWRGRALSFDDLSSQLAKNGRISVWRVDKACRAKVAQGSAVWITCREDEDALEAVFPGAEVIDVSWKASR